MLIIQHLTDRNDIIIVFSVFIVFRVFSLKLNLIINYLIWLLLTLHCKHVWTAKCISKTDSLTHKLEAVVRFLGMRFWWVYCAEHWWRETRWRGFELLTRIEVFVGALGGGWKPSIHVPLKQLLLSMCARKQRGWFISVCMRFKRVLENL